MGKSRQTHKFAQIFTLLDNIAKLNFLDESADQNPIGVQFGIEQDERLGAKMSPGLAGKPGLGGLDGNFNGQSYNSPVASLQTWVNGFAPPTSLGDVKSETANGANDPNSTPPGGVEAVYKTDTSSNVSPLSSTLSANVPYSSHPYAATATTSASSYDQSAAAAAASAYYAAGGAYYHPATLSSMDPYGYSSTAQSTASSQPFAQAKFWALSWLDFCHHRLTTKQSTLQSWRDQYRSH